jgi:hypothetical protein
MKGIGVAGRRRTCSATSRGQQTSTGFTTAGDYGGETAIPFF